MLKCYKIGAADAVNNSTAKKKHKQRVQKERNNKGGTAYHINMFRSKKEDAIVVLNAKESMKVKCQVVSGYKHRSNMSFVCLECKLQQDRYD